MLVESTLTLLHSGLDATAATKLIQTLRDLADDGKTIVAVIHQPSQHVFDKFDDIMLVSEGRLMYFGPREEVRAYMNKYGCKAPADMGTAEHILDCVSADLLEGETAEDAANRMERLAKYAANQNIDLGVANTASDSNRQLQRFSSGLSHRPRSSLLTQFRLLLQRSFREISRGKLVLFVKLVQQVTTALIYGGIYSLGTNQASIQDRFGLLSLIAIGTANMAIAQSIRAFPREKSIISGELASRMYRTLPYFVGKALAEIPLVTFMSSVFGSILYRLTGLSRMTGKFRNFLGLLSMHGITAEATGLLIGAFSPSSDIALAVFPAILVINIIFDGKNISEENTPRLLKWVPKIGLIRWGFEGLCVNEFEGLEFDTSGPRRGPVAKTGADALARFGLGSRSLGDVLRAQMIITGGFYALSYLGLTLTRQRFQVMQPPLDSKQALDIDKEKEL
jgi:ABC-type multidrug transport system permease subunit